MAWYSPPNGEGKLAIVQRDVYTTKFYRHGKSWGILIPQELREVMGLQPGDRIALNFNYGILWCKRITVDMIVTREQVSQIFDKLFPGKNLTNGRHD
jgi:antitoxin component of MazEF toxin-antitoxin module